MTESTLREILEAIRRGLEETARRFADGRRDQMHRHPKPRLPTDDVTESWLSLPAPSVMARPRKSRPQDITGEAPVDLYDYVVAQSPQQSLIDDQNQSSSCTAGEPHSGPASPRLRCKPRDRFGS